MLDLAEVKQVNLNDLHAFLEQDHTAFNVLSVSTKHIESTNRIAVSLTKNSARSFYLDKQNKPKLSLVEKVNIVKDNCLTDAQNCQYFKFFNSKEKKLHSRYCNIFEANFFCSCSPDNCPHKYLFLTGTYNISCENLSAWTTNWDKSDDCWNSLKGKRAYDLKEWAQQFDPHCEAMKVLLPPVKVDASQFATIKKHFRQLTRDINRLWKPSNWKWAVIFELQKNGNWHWHLFTTPFIPYSHKCVLDSEKSTNSCWNCRTYLNDLWPYGRVESRSLDKRAARQYCAKYLAKGFHLRTLYREHGLTDHQRAYHFYQNLYDYEEREVVFNGKSKIDQETGQFLNGNQTVFHRYDYQTHATSFYYRTNKKLVGKCAKPVLIKKNFRLGTRSLNPLNLLKLAKQSLKKPVIKLRKSPLKNNPFDRDFQEFLITRLLLLCKTAEFTNIPLEQKQVPKDARQCSGSVAAHFQTKPVLHFTFAPDQAGIVREFIEKLDDYAEEYDMEESKDFIFYPSEESKSIWTPTQARNQYLDNWWMDYGQTSPYQQVYWG